MKTMEQEFNDRLAEKQVEIDSLKAENFALRKASQIATREFIKSETITAEEVESIQMLYPTFEIDVAYKINDIVLFNSILYKVLQAHTSQSDWTPDVAVSLFTPVIRRDVINEYVQPTGATDAYSIGDKVLFEGKTYESLIDANVWTPSEYPQGWKELV